MTKIASMTPPIPRGTVIGRRVGVQPIDEAEHFFKCEACGGWLGGAPTAAPGLASLTTCTSLAAQTVTRVIALRKLKPIWKLAFTEIKPFRL
jgi:hypothetical protein